jgi:hypothetical protein
MCLLLQVKYVWKTSSVQYSRVGCTLNDFLLRCSLTPRCSLVLVLGLPHKYPYRSLPPDSSLCPPAFFSTGMCREV